MKTLLASVFALAMLGAGVANADVIGAHVGPVGVGIGVHDNNHHHRHCDRWGHRHHECRHWAW